MITSILMICPNCQEPTGPVPALDPMTGIEFEFCECPKRCFQFQYENGKLISYYLKMEADGLQIWGSKNINRTTIRPIMSGGSKAILDMPTFLEVELKDIRPLIQRLLNLKAFS